MDFDDELGELVERALGSGGVDIDDVIRSLQIKLSAAKDLRRDGDAVFDEFPDADGGEHDADW